MELIFSFISIFIYKAIIELLEESFRLKCTRGNPASSVCGDSKSKKPSLSCKDEQCQCHQFHESCTSFSMLSKLKVSLKKKGLRYEPVLVQVHKFLQSKSKLINIELNKIEKILKKKQLFLNGDEGKLYQLMKEEKHDLIFPSLVDSVHLSLKNEYQHEVEKKIEQTKKQLEKADDYFQMIIDVVLKLTMSQTRLFTGSTDEKGKNYPNFFRFSEKLHSQKLEIIGNNTVKVIDQAGRYWTALVKPYLSRQQFHSHKINFKIHQVTNSFLIFGVCQLTEDVKITASDIYNKIQFGSFTQTNLVFVGKSKGHRKERSNIKIYQNGDLVSIEYECQSQRVVVRNVTKETQSVSYIKSESTLPLYFEVMLGSQNDSVEIVRGKDEL